MNDAELSIGIEDNVTANVGKIVAAVRSLGSAVNAEAKQIDKSAAQVSKSLVQMTSGAAGGSGAAAKPKALEAATAQLAKYRAEMEKLSHASDVKLTGSGRFQSVQTGRLVSGADVTAYEKAAAGAQSMERAIMRIDAAQKATKTSTYQLGQASNEAYQSQRRIFNEIDTTKVDRSAKTLKKVYSDMWGARSQFREFWPPEMFKGVDGFVSAMEQMPNSARYAMYDVANSTAIGGIALGAFGIGAIGMAASFQRAFADVKRTVQTDVPGQIDEIRDSLIRLSAQAPVAFQDLAAIASVGGQMGISADGIVNYTETIAKLTATTNLTADAASIALGRFKSFFAEASDPSLAVTDATFENLASSVLKVGVNSVATESGIVNVATQISSMGSYAGLTANQVIGVAGALSSIGVPPELSRGVITRLFNNIGESASNGGDRLEAFAELAGMSAEQFKASWKTEDFATTFTALISGLNDMTQSGGDAVGTLHDLGITSVRDVPVLLRLAGAAGEAGTAGSLLAQTLADAESGWRQNTELAAQYALISETLVERLKVLGNAFSNLFASIGNVGVGPATVLVDTLINITNGLRIISESPAGQVLGAIAISMTLLASATLLAGAGFARFITFAQSAVTGLTAMHIPLTTATVLVNGLKYAMLGIGALFTIMAIAAPFIAMQDSAEHASAAVQNTAGALQALRADTDSGAAGFKTYTARTSEMAKEMTDAERLGRDMAGMLGNVEKSGHGAGDGVEAATRSMYTFGTASTQFIKDALLADEALSDFMQAGTGGTGFEQLAEQAGYSADKLIEAYARGGREGAAAYIKGISGIEAYSMGEIGLSKLTQEQRQLSLSSDAVLDALDRQFEGMDKVAIKALVQGDSMRKLGEGTQYATEVTEEFATANDEALKKAGEAMAKFVDPKKLIKFTQDFANAAGLQGEEQEKAAQKAQEAWDTYYGGASISLDEYLKVFQGAAQIQEQHINNLNALAARNQLSDEILQDLRELGPEGVPLVQALVDGTDEELQRYKKLYGQTGFDAMVAMAASQMQAQSIVENAARALGKANMRKFSEELRAGTPLVDALKKWQLDAEGNPLKADVVTRMNAREERMKLQNMVGNGISIPVRPYLTQSQLRVNLMAYSSQGYFSGPNRVNRGNFWSGGFTGHGGKYEYAGNVHRGEVVTPKEDVDQRTGKIKESALLRMLNGGRPARNNSGSFASGGFAAQSFGGGGVVELGPASIQALARSLDPRLFLDGRDLSQSVKAFDAAAQLRGEG